MLGKRIQPRKIIEFCKRFIQQEVLLLLPAGFYVLNSYLPEIIGKLNIILFTGVLLVFMVMCAFNIVRHAHDISEILGQPYGALVLTIAVTAIEIAIIISSTLNHGSSLSLLKDTAFSVIMVSINGFAGLSLFVGGLKYTRQRYNLEGAHSYIAILGVLMTICLILPNYISSAVPGSFDMPQAIIVSAICIVSYIALLFKQTITHRDSFVDREIDTEEERAVKASPLIFYNILLITLGLLVIIL